MSDNLKGFLAERLEADQHTAEAAGYDTLETVVERIFAATSNARIPHSVRDALLHVAREMAAARGAVGGYWAREVAEVLAGDTHTTGT